MKDPLVVVSCYITKILPHEPLSKGGVILRSCWLKMRGPLLTISWRHEKSPKIKNLTKSTKLKSRA